ncbi:MAG: hypothetical protein IBX56_20170 [Methylomicrobium sp.]|nr:hypothetical protein [Methylomicrobium sp.]
MSKLNLKVGDIVRIPKYSELTGQRDSSVDRQMAKVIYRVTGVQRYYCGSDEESWLDNLALVEAETGEKSPYMIWDKSVEKINA